MVKKALHHFNRSLIVGFEVVGILAVVACFAWGMLLWRLSQGPLNADFLTDRVERALNDQEGGFTFDVGTTLLTWGGRLEPVEMQMKDVRVSRTGGGNVLSVDTVGVQLAKRRLVFGSIVPKVIRLHGLALRVMRGEDGHVAFSLGNGDAASLSLPQQQAGAEEGPQGGEFIAGLLAELQENRIPFLGGLQEVDITGGSVFYDDRTLGVLWRARRADITFERSPHGLVADLKAAIAQEGGVPAGLHIVASHDAQSGLTKLAAAFNGFVPARAVQGSNVLKPFSGVDMPLKGSVEMMLDREFRPGLARFVLGSDEGLFNAPGLYAAPITVKKIYLNGAGDFRTQEGALKQVRIELEGANAEGEVHTVLKDGKRSVAAKAALYNMKIDALNMYWPESLAPSPREWVTRHLSKGVAQEATLDLALSVDENAEKKTVTVDRLGGQIDFTGITVDYFPPLMPVAGVDGRAFYDQKTFSLDLISGRLGDMLVTKSAIRITGLDTQDAHTHSNIDIAVSLKGPLATALKVLDSKPLEYPKSLGLQTSDVSGAAQVDVGFKFPLLKDLLLDQVHVTAEAKADNVLLKNIVTGLPLSGGPVALSLTSDAMTVKGAGKLGDMPVTFDWARNFSHEAKVSGKINARLAINAAGMRAFGVPEELHAGGTLPAIVTYTTSRDGSGDLLLQGDMAAATLDVPLAGFKKEAGTPGALELTLHTKDGKLNSISGLSMQAGGATVAGGVDFKADGSLKKAALSRVLLGDTDIALAVEKAADGGYAFKVNGRQLDASRMFAKDDGTGDRNAEAMKKTLPVTVTMDIARLLTGKDRAIEKVKMLMRRNAWQRIDQMEMDGVAGGGAIYLRYMPTQGGHKLRFEADSAGLALHALGITSGVRGGKLVVDGVPLPKSGPRDMAGSIILTNFGLADMPVLARLLNAMSLTGIIDLLNGSGIAFKKMRAGFVWTDRGPPTDAHIVRVIGLKDGQTSGSSLGLTFEGTIDNWNNIYDLDGTIVPVSDLSKLLNTIPILGNVLTAGGEGIFAATYKIKGPKDQPSVSVNPLAALAPGVLRKIFFEN